MEQPFKDDFARIAEYVENSEAARLLPILADSQGEKRLTSIFLAILMIVGEYGKGLLGEIGAPAGKRARIRCVAEPRFKKRPDGAKLQPDGLIVVYSGSDEWWALVEAKVHNSSLDAEQLDQYHELAWMNDLDAIITISNDHAEELGHVPVQAQTRKRTPVPQFHWSWHELRSRAVILAEHVGVDDPERAYLLKEFVRHLDHPKSGMREFSSMGDGWKAVCEAIQHARGLNRTDPSVHNVVRAWHQLLGHVAIELKLEIGHQVDVRLSAAHKNDANERLRDDVAALVSEGKLAADIVIPDAVGPLRLVADFSKRTLTATMEVRPPRDRTKASACGTWIRNQLKDCADEAILIDAFYPGRAPNITVSLAELREDQRRLVSSKADLLPSRMEIRKVQAEKDFAAPVKFVGVVRDLVVGYYTDVGQWLHSWRAKAPPVVKEDEEVPA